MSEKYIKTLIEILNGVSVTDTGETSLKKYEDKNRPTKTTKTTSGGINGKFVHFETSKTTEKSID